MTQQDLDSEKLKRSTQELSDDATLLRTVVDSLSDCFIFVKDTKSRFVTTNAHHLKALGAKVLEDVIGKTDFDFFPRESAEQYFRDEQEVVRTGQPLLSCDERMPDIAGGMRWLLTTKLPLRDASGTITGLVGISRDITDRKESELELARHRDHLGELVFERTGKLQQLNDQLSAEIAERRLAEERLQEEHKRLLAIMENLPGCHIFIKDRRSRFLTTNASHLEVLGLRSMDQVLGRLDFDFFPGELAERYYAAEQELMRTGRMLVNCEEPYVGKNGKAGWLLSTKVPLRNAKGEITGLAGMSFDITEQRRISEEIRASRQMLRIVLDSITPRVVWKGRDSAYLGCNASFARDAGLMKPDEVVGRTDYDLPWPKEQADAWRAADRRVMDANTSEFREVSQNVLADGRRAWLEVNRQPLHDLAGQVSGLLWTYEDVTDRQEAEARIMQERNTLRTLIDNIPHAIYIKDRDSRFLVANRTSAAILSLEDAGPMVGKTDFDFFPHSLASEFHADEQEVMRTGVPVINKPEQIPNSSGQLRWILTTKQPLKDQDGRVTGLVGVGIDITERRHEEEKRGLLEEQLRQAEKMRAIGQLAGGIAHDFNNQLAAIMASADLIRNWPDDKKVMDHAQMILTASRRAADLTGKLLAFARKGRYQLVPVNIHKLIGEVVSLLERSIDKRIRIVQRLRAVHPVVKGDPTQLQNALLNIAINARDAMHNEGEIVFSTEEAVFDEEYCAHQQQEMKPGRYIQVGVSDTGIGMDDETKKHIFEPFFTTKKEGEGTGMGLAAVYGTVKNHQGSVLFTSELGFGTHFKICLPMAEGEQEKVESTVADTVIRGHARILVVDDEEVVRATIMAVMSKLGYQVTTCSDGEEAIEFYRGHWKDVDLVILDMVMPRMGGLETFAKLREVNPAIKCVLSSGYSIAGEAQKILDEGVLGFVQKPFHVAQLSRQISEALARR